MGKSTGFIEYKRHLPKDRLPLERINDWDEFHNELTLDEQRMQGARCMDCGIPFCHSGVLLSGMASGCPLNNLIPEWNDLIYNGLYKEAFDRLLKTNNLPEFTARVCPAPCEGACTVGLNEPQVTIKNNERFIVDYAYKNGYVKPNPPLKRTGKKVAVIGTGPSGLACADQLNKLGHLVTVFERADRFGGLLMYGIPNMKLDKRVVENRIEIMKTEGIKFKNNIEVGLNYSIDELLSSFDAVVVCIGSTKPRDLNITGRNSKGIHFAMEFLHANTKSLLDSNHKDTQFISAKDKNVIIIGGGDTGTDCVATSLRHKCRNLTQFEIMPKPPSERQTNNPWPEWPKVCKIDYGQEEYQALYGKDPREYLIMTEKFVADENMNVKEVHTVEVEWKKDFNGNFMPAKKPDTNKTWSADLVLICMGFLGPESTLLEKLGVIVDAKTNIKTEDKKYQTNVKGVFAAGDARRGQSLVVWAINEGREAAYECNRYLMKK